MLSFLATLPLLVAYDGPTNIVVPKPFRPMLGVGIDLGMFLCCAYVRLYISLLYGIYCCVLHEQY